MFVYTQTVDPIKLLLSIKKIKNNNNNHGTTKCKVTYSIQKAASKPNTAASLPNIRKKYSNSSNIINYNSPENRMRY